MGRVLGEGTFAKVYAATELGSGKLIAVKVIKKEAAARKSSEQVGREISVVTMD